MATKKTADDTTAIIENVPVAVPDGPPLKVGEIALFYPPAITRPGHHQTGRPCPCQIWAAYKSNSGQWLFDLVYMAENQQSLLPVQQIPLREGERNLLCVGPMQTG